MRLPNKSLDNTSSPETYSEEWRIQEAKDIIDLLRQEYKNSKKLNVMKRYKEMERIINMITSEPVLMKLLWLTSVDIEGTSSLDYETISDGDKADQESTRDDATLEWQDRPLNSQNKVLNGLKTLTNRLKSLAPFTNTFNFSKSMTSPDLDMSTDLDYSTPCFFFDQDSSSPVIGHPSPPLSCLSDGPLMSPSSSSNNCFPFNIGPFPYDPETSSCQAIMRNSCSTSDGGNYLGFSSANIDTGSLNHKNLITNDDTCTYSKKSLLRRRGIETCIIKRSEIPTFQIPQKRPSIERKHDLSIDCLLYLKSTSIKPTGKRSGLNMSVSTPTMTDRSRSSFGPKIKGFLQSATRKKRCYSDNCLQQSSIDSQKLPEMNDCDYLPGFPLRTSKRENYSIPSNMNSFYYEALGCPPTSSIMKAYDSLTQLKSEFEQLNDKSFLARYRKMKTMIKSCMEVRI